MAFALFWSLTFSQLYGNGWGIILRCQIVRTIFLSAPEGRAPAQGGPGPELGGFRGQRKGLGHCPDPMHLASMCTAFFLLNVL